MRKSGQGDEQNRTEHPSPSHGKGREVLNHLNPNPGCALRRKQVHRHRRNDASLSRYPPAPLLRSIHSRTLQTHNHLHRQRFFERADEQIVDCLKTRTLLGSDVRGRECPPREYYPPPSQPPPQRPPPVVRHCCLKRTDMLDGVGPMAGTLYDVVSRVPSEAKKC